MFVVVAHFIERTPLKDSFFFAHVNLGQVGVVIFFVISGMVIPYSLKQGRHALAVFAVSRFFRLYPAYWFSIALAVASSDWFLSTPVPLSTVLINMTMLQAAVQTPDLFGVYWTLIIEMFFYVACAALFSVGLLGKAWVRLSAAIGLLAVALIFAITRFYLAKKIPVALPLCLSIMFSAVCGGMSAWAWRMGKLTDTSLSGWHYSRVCFRLSACWLTAPIRATRKIRWFI